MNAMFTDWEIQYCKDVMSPQTGFGELDKLILKYLCGNASGPFITKILFTNEKQKMKGLALPNINIYHRAIRIKTVCYCHKERQM